MIQSTGEIEEGDMGTAMKFVIGLAGFLFVCIGLGIVATPLYEVLSDPSDIDFPGGAFGLVGLILIAGSAPFLIGVFLLRKAFRRGSQALAPAAAPAGAPVQTAAAPIAAAAVSAETPTETLPPPPSFVAAAIRPRPWLAVLGLCLIVVALLTEGLLAAFSISTSPGVQTRIAVGFFMLAAAVPLALGVWLAHVGDPGIGRRFAADFTGHLYELRKPSAVVATLRTSMGLAAATAVVGVPLMLIWRRESVMIGVGALSVFSVADPVLNLFRRSWWIGAIVSASAWMALLLVLAITADAIERLREGSLVFLLPMMIYAGAIGLSAVVRFVMWVSGSGSRPQHPS